MTYQTTNHMVKLYEKNLKAVSEYFGISKDCAQYMYHRAIKSLRTGNAYLPWNIQLQNAIVTADKCLGMNWKSIEFGKENESLVERGIILEDMPKKVFRWVDSDKTEMKEDGWVEVSHKKKEMSKMLLNMKRRGIII